MYNGQQTASQLNKEIERVPVRVSTYFPYPMTRLRCLWPYDRRYLKGLAATFVTAAALLMINALSLTPAINLAISALVATVTFFGVLLLLGLDLEDKAFIGSIWGKVRPA